MRVLSVVLEVITWLAALVAVVGAASVHPAVMGVAGLTAALTALVWGLVAAIRKPRRVPPPGVVEHRRPCRDVSTETTHRPTVARSVIQGGQRPVDDARRPFWDPEIMGAPE